MTAISVSERLLEMAAFYTPLALTVTVPVLRETDVLSVMMVHMNDADTAYLDMPHCSTCLRKRKASTYASAQEKMLSAEHAARRRRGMKILAVGRDPTLLAEVCACLNPHAGRLSARSKPYEWKMLRRCLRCIPSPIRKNTSLICMRAARPFSRGRPTTQFPLLCVQ